MNQQVIAGRIIETGDDGYFTDPAQWDREVASEMAIREGFVLTDKHFLILEFLRNRYFTGHALTVRSISNAGLAEIKEFYQLFPGAPLKVAIRLAGIPKPKGCY